MSKTSYLILNIFFCFKNIEDVKFLEVHLSNYIVITDSFRGSLTHGTFSSLVHNSLVCGFIWTFFTVLLPRIYDGFVAHSGIFNGGFEFWVILES